MVWRERDSKSNDAVTTRSTDAGVFVFMKFPRPPFPPPLCSPDFTAKALGAAADVGGGSDDAEQRGVPGADGEGRGVPRPSSGGA